MCTIQTVNLSSYSEIPLKTRKAFVRKYMSEALEKKANFVCVPLEDWHRYLYRNVEFSVYNEATMLPASLKSSTVNIRNYQNYGETE
jgi:hypothetical protein